MRDPMNSVLFLDRDGVICRDRADYVKSWEEFRFIPGVKAALRALREAEIPVLIITNQSVINRGILTREALDSLHRKMIRDIVRAGGEISGIYYCPHRPEEGCDCRKPGTALLKQAARDHHLNLKKCVFVGDTLKDLEAGKGVGCRTILVQTGQGRETLNKIFQMDRPGSNFWIAGDLFRSVDLIIRLMKDNPLLPDFLRIQQRTSASKKNGKFL
jgi:D-glycero-D-manno-heptose 1,7-bisphosphate phosphatase